MDGETGDTIRHCSMVVAAVVALFYCGSCVSKVQERNMEYRRMQYELEIKLKQAGCPR